MAEEAQKRRNFILERLKRFGMIRNVEITHAFEGVSSNSISNDLKVLEESGYRLASRTVGREKLIYWLDSRTVTVKQFRAKECVAEKGEIARMVSSLICGFDEGEAKHYGLGAETYPHTTLEEYLNRGTKKFPDHIFEKIASFWRAPQRSVAIDAGTTTDAIADELRTLTIPNSKFTHLYLWTNSRSIFEKTGTPDCNIKTIMIGGQQRHQSETVSGELAQQCLRAWNPQFGISIIGATSVDMKRNTFGAYNDSESAMKADLLACAGIKIVVADSSKFADYPVVAASPVGEIHPNFVDFIITDQYRSGKVPKSISQVPVLSAHELCNFTQKDD